MLNVQLEDRWNRAGRAGGVVALALLGLADTAVSVIVDGLDPLRWSVCAVPSLATAMLWLRADRLGPRLLAPAVVALAVCSLAGTVWLIGLDSEGSWGWAETFGLLMLLITVVRRSQGWLMPVQATALCLALCVQPARGTSIGWAQFFGCVQGLLAAAAVVVGLYLRFQAAARAQQLAAVRAEQRAEFARDLHDFVAHHVTGIVVQAQGARYVAGTNPELAVDALGEIEQAGAQTMSAMRRMIGVLRQEDDQAPLTQSPGLGELVPLIEGFTAVGGPEVRLAADDVPGDLPVEVASSAYRVVMEALTNVRKHAGAASTVDVGLQHTPEWLFVRVVNDGPQPSGQRSWTAGFESRSGFGLLGLTERVSAIGGRLRAGPGIDGGWVVEAALPLAGGTGAEAEDGR
ncbi:histidine kinase [Streptomyces cadmiisoli]|uniref:histidine kinase n=1 Tax=Streptomyces cadmiisoli TaxID=2184053 RepID=UPI003D74D2AF